MPSSITCHHCNTTLRVPDATTGKKFRCPKCKEVITLGATSLPEKKSPPVLEVAYSDQKNPRSNVPATPRKRQRKDDYEEERDHRRGRPPASSNLPWIIAGISAALLLLVSTGFAVTLFVMWESSDKPVAQGPKAFPVANPVPPNNPQPNNPVPNNPPLQPNNPFPSNPLPNNPKPKPNNPQPTLPPSNEPPPSKLDPAPANPKLEKTEFRYHSVAGAVMAPDERIMVLSIPTKAQLAFIDTLLGKEIKLMDVPFQPGRICVQNNKLYVANLTAPQIYAFDIDSGEQLGKYTVPGNAFENMTCHPKVGPIYATNLSNDVYAIDPSTGASHNTGAKGQLIVVDPVRAEYVYTGIQKPIQEKLVFEEGPGDSVIVWLGKANLNATMLKYRVDGNRLVLVGANSNASINGRGLGISPDGKHICMPGGGGWRPLNSPRYNYCMALFETSDMNTAVGQISTGAYPGQIAWHPHLNYIVAYKSDHYGKGLSIVKTGSYVKIVEYHTEQQDAGGRVLVGGRGTKAIFIPLFYPGRTDQNPVIQIFDIPVTDADRAALKKVYKQ